MYLALLILFAVVHLMGLSQNYNLRFLNGIIHLFFLHVTITAYRKRYPETSGNYLSGVAMAFYMSLIAGLLFSISMLIFLELNEPFFLALKEQFPYPNVFKPWTAVIGIMVEAIGTALIGGYIITRMVDK